MKDKHNVILIHVSSTKFNFWFPEWFIISHSRFEMLYLSFPEFQVFILSRHKVSSNHCKDSPCVFNLSFLSFDHSFVYWSSSWMFYMMVHQGFNSFSKCSSTFFSEEFKHSSSCNPECNSFTHIFWGGVMSFLIISLRASWFTSYQEMRYFKSIYLFVGVTLGYISPKDFPKDCCYLWCL